MVDVEKILLGFWLTEKSNFLTSSKNQYVFHVAIHATREQVRQAVCREFGVSPVHVNVLRQKGKVRRMRVTRRHAVAIRGVCAKKAFVTLRADDKIEIN
ncbi:MAG: 50S ribosomal protein L23 [Puniceicoccales bacterium]|jgi:large subunit ribosomal protein L23|nr:50S ribosomal protein L23 [Puniceicoccales bacterium]